MSRILIESLDGRASRKLILDHSNWAIVTSLWRYDVTINKREHGIQAYFSRTLLSEILFLYLNGTGYVSEK